MVILGNTLLGNALTQPSKNPLLFPSLNSNYSNSNSRQVKKYMNDPITTSEILFLLSLIGVVRVYVNIFLGHSFTFVPQVIHSLRRIQVWKM